MFTEVPLSQLYRRDRHKGRGQRDARDEYLMAAPPPENVPPAPSHARDGVSSGERADEEGRKLFVGAVSRSTTDEGFIAFFEQFGVVEEATVMRDRETGESRGFGFVTYAERAAADRMLDEPRPVLDGRRLDAKRAVPRSGNRP